MRKKKKSLAPMPQIIAQVLQRGMTGEQWSANLDEKLSDLLGSLLSPAELISFHVWRDGLPGTEPMLNKLDKVILRQAQTAGWRLALARIVQKRFSEWETEKGGPKRFARLGRAYAKAARIIQGLELPPLDDPQLYLTKAESVSELRALQAKMSQKFPTKQCSVLELGKFFVETVSDEGQKLVSLRRNVERWEAFFQQEENLRLLLGFVHRDRVQRITAVSLFDAWMAWCKGAARGKPMDQETVRKKISEAGKSFRS